MRRLCMGQGDFRVHLSIDGRYRNNRERNSMEEAVVSATAVLRDAEC